MNIRSILTISLVVLCASTIAQNWTGNVNSDWEDGGNWSGGTVPATGQSVIIDSTSNYTGNMAHPVIITASSFSPKKLAVKGGGKLELNGSTARLTVSGRDVVVDNNYAVGFTSSLFVSNGGTLTIQSDKKLKVKKGGLISLTGGSIQIEKGLEVDDATFWMSESTGTSTLVLNTDMNLKGKLKVKCLSSNSSFNASAGITLINAGDAFTMELDGRRTAGAVSATINISGGILTNEGPTRFKNQIDDITIITISGGIVDLQGVVAVKPTAGKMDINLTGGELIFQSDVILEAQDQITQSGSSTIRFQSTGVIQNDGTISCTDGTVSFEGTTTLLNNGEWQFNHVEITAGSILDQSTAARIKASGNWTNNGGTFSAGINSVTLNGSGTQTIDVSANETFYDFTVDPTSTAHVSTTSQITIDNIEQIEGTLDNDGIVNFSTGFDNSSGTLSGDGTHNITGGNWNNIGTFMPESSEVVFNGSLFQRMEGTTEFNDLVIDNTNNVSIIAGTHSVYGTVTPTNGTFETNNALVLKSDANGTGRIMTIQPTSDVTGEVEVQRFVEAGLTGWRMQTSAVQNQTLANWTDDFTTAGFPGSDYPSFSFVSMRTYNETIGGSKDHPLSWDSPLDISDAINVGEGFWIWSGNGLPVTAAFTIDNKGIINKGDISKDLDFTSSGGALDDGWNLVGNPYPAPIDFDSPNWTKTNMDGTFWVWNTDTQSFSSWTTVGGVSTNGGTAEIASSQAIWVKANAVGASITVRETCKTTGVVEFKSTSISEDHISMKIVGNGWQDEAVLRFYPGGTSDYDPQLDAPKMYSGNTAVPGIASLASGIDYGVNTLSDSLQDHSIPVRAIVGATGTYIIEFSGTENFPTSACLYFEDLLLDSLVDLKYTSSYECNISDTTTAPRFLIHMSKPHDVQATSPNCFNSNDGTISATGYGSGPWTYDFYDDSNNLLHTETINGTGVLENLTPGVYHVSIANSGGSCTSLIEDSIVVEAALPIEASSSENDPNCYGAQDGEIDLTVTGGTSPYTVNWSNGMSGNVVSGLGAGNYQGTIHDANGCSDTISVALSNPLEVVAQFTSADTIYMSVGPAMLTANNISINSSLFNWSFGDGNTSSIENALHEYAAAGTYVVSLTAENMDGCTDIYTKSIVVLEEMAADLSALSNDYTLTAQLSNGVLTLQGSFSDNVDLTVKIFNLVGQVSAPTIRVKGKAIQQTVDISDLTKGIYIISISDNSFTEVFKVLHQ
jgi:PKD repeat protein